MCPTDKAHARSVRQARGALRISSDALTTERHPPEAPIPQLLVAEQDDGVGRQHLHVALDHFLGLRMVMVILSHLKLAARFEEKQALDGFYFFNRKMIELAAELEKEEGASTRPSENQERCQDRHVPNGQAGTEMARAEAHQVSFCSRRMKPTPRTVWRSLRSNCPSSFRRRRTTCASITLSSGVCRAVSFQMSRASISRETTRPWLAKRYRSRSNSRAVSSTGWPPRMTHRCATSISRSASLSRCPASGCLPLLSRTRRRASSSGKASRIGPGWSAQDSKTAPH